MIKNIALLKGGLSSEAEISNLSASYVKKALLENGYNVKTVNVDHSFLEWAFKNKNDIDVIFNALHGNWGEDGKIQGFFEYLKIPYTHSGVLASAVGMNKYLSKKIFESDGLPVPSGNVLSKELLFIKNNNYKIPFVVKPISEGSSLDIFIIKNLEDFYNLKKKIDTDKYLVENFIDGIDITVGLMGGKALGLLEIETNNSFYDFNAKYKSNKTSYIKPIHLSSEIVSKIIDYSERANSILNCKGITRVDFRYDERKGNDGIYILEINTQPGLTETSLLPRIAKDAGISFPKLIDWIVKDAGVDK